MTNDKIAEIKERHKRVYRDEDDPSILCPQTHEDRGILLAEVERLTKERDEVSSVLAAHSGKGSTREWHQGGAWLYPGDKIVVVVVEDGQ